MGFDQNSKKPKNGEIYECATYFTGLGGLVVVLREGCVVLLEGRKVKSVILMGNCNGIC